MAPAAITPLSNDVPAERVARLCRDGLVPEKGTRQTAEHGVDNRRTDAMS